MKFTQIKIKAGRYLTPVNIAVDGGRVYLKFAYNKLVLKLVKDSFAGRRWDPDKKLWHFPISDRNMFILESLQGKNPFLQWDGELKTFPIPQRHTEGCRLPLWEHQIELYNHVLTRRQSIIVGDMGTGKTRVAVMVAEHLMNSLFQLKEGEAWFVGTVNACTAVSREMEKWECPIKFQMFTYNKIVSYLETYTGPAPRLLVADEASKLKNWVTQRSKAVYHATEAMRAEHGDDYYFVEMSGTPAPKAPTDWWSLVEIARPGFLREGSVAALRDTLCLIEQREGATGIYPHIITWLDDEEKCSVCGILEKAHPLEIEIADHGFSKSTNELSRLYRRLKGLVMIKKLDDCLDLPDRVRRVVRVKPSMDMIRAANLIKKSSHRAPQKLILLRELSDGFQYQDVENGYSTCPRCNGTSLVFEHKAQDADWERLVSPESVELDTSDTEEIACPHCDGQGVVKNYKVEPNFVGTPKDGYVNFLLDEHEEYGRFVIWASFTAAISRVVELCLAKGWAVLRIDGKGIHALGTEANSDMLLDCMDYSNGNHNQLLRDHPKVVVVAHPESGGMSYTFTSSPADLYYDNDFNTESKLQSAARIRRGGMHETRKCTSYEVIHLPVDRMVLDKLDMKKELQGVTLDDLTNYKFDDSDLEYFDGEGYR